MTMNVLTCLWNNDNLLNGFDNSYECTVLAWLYSYGYASQWKQCCYLC